MAMDGDHIRKLLMPLLLCVVLLAATLTTGCFDEGGEEEAGSHGDRL